MSLFLGILAMLPPPMSAVTLTPLDKPTVTVSARDLDLADPAQARRMERRIASAVSAVCNSHRAGGAAAQARYAECRTVAMVGVRARVDHMLAVARGAPRAALARK